MLDFEDQRRLDLLIDAANKELLGWHRHLGPMRDGERNSSPLDVTVPTDTKVFGSVFFFKSLIKRLF